MDSEPEVEDDVVPCAVVYRAQVPDFSYAHLLTDDIEDMVLGARITCVPNASSSIGKVQGHRMRSFDPNPEIEHRGFVDAKGSLHRALAAGQSHGLGPVDGDATNAIV